MFHLEIMVEKLRPDLLTLFMKFHDLSVSRNLFSKAKKRQFASAGPRSYAAYDTVGNQRVKIKY